MRWSAHRIRIPHDSSRIPSTPATESRPWSYNPPPHTAVTPAHPRSRLRFRVAAAVLEDCAEDSRPALALCYHELQPCTQPRAFVCLTPYIMYVFIVCYSSPPETM